MSWFLLVLTGCGDAASCNAVFDLTFPDGSVANMDVCTSITAVGSFELDPDDPPEFRSAVIRLSPGEAEEDLDCFVQLELNGLCGTGRHEIGPAATVLWTTYDCSGIPDDFEAEFEATSGFVDLSLVSTGEELGTPEEETLSAFLAGAVEVEAVDGTRLAGSFDLVQDFSWADTEDKDCLGTEPTDTTTDTGPPAPGDISVSPTSLDFGTVTAGTVAVESLLLANTGEGDLFVEAITSDDPAWTWRGNTVPRVINPGQSTTLYVDFAPSEAVTYSGNLMIECDDPDQPTLPVPLSGEGG